MPKKTGEKIDEIKEKLDYLGLSLEDAKTIAVTNVNLNVSDVQFKKEKQDYDDGRLVYEIEFIYENYEYDYEISQTGEIISFDKDLLYK